MDGRRFLEKVRQWWEAASAIVLMTVAAIGIVYGGLHVAGHKILTRLANPEEIIIFLVAALCGGLGAERLITLKKIGDDIETAQTQRTTLVATAERIAHDIDRISTKIGRLRTEVVADIKGVERREDDIIHAVKQINKAEALVGLHEIEDAARQLVENAGTVRKLRRQVSTARVTDYRAVILHTLRRAFPKRSKIVAAWNITSWCLQLQCRIRARMNGCKHLRAQM